MSSRVTNTQRVLRAVLDARCRGSSPARGWRGRSACRHARPRRARWRSACPLRRRSRPARCRTASAAPERSRPCDWMRSGVTVKPARRRASWTGRGGRRGWSCSSVGISCCGLDRRGPLRHGREVARVERQERAAALFPDAVAVAEAREGALVPVLDEAGPRVAERLAVDRLLQCRRSESIATVICAMAAAIVARIQRPRARISGPDRARS